MEALIRRCGKLCTSMGRSLDQLGVRTQGKTAVLEKLCPSCRVVGYNGHNPNVSQTTFIAPTATVSGDVLMKAGSTLGYGSVLRGDCDRIAVGENTQIKDNVVVHVDYQLPTLVGDNCVIDTRAILHACTIGNGCLIGAGATVLDGAIVEDGAAIAPGSVVTPKKHVGKDEIWSGIPARKVRDVTEEEKKEIGQLREAIRSLAATTAVETSKDLDEREEDEFARNDEEFRNPQDGLNPYGNTLHPERRGALYDRLPQELDDGDEPPGMVYRKDARFMQDLDYDIAEEDDREHDNLPHLPRPPKNH